MVVGAQRFYSKELDDNRNAFQRDRDRIIYSGHYRRLAGITQVVSALEGHVFHNRLTHTFKVAQVARRITENLLHRYSADGKESGEHLPPISRDVLDPDVTESAAHAHDIGHPPFGHIAEIRLQELMKEHCGIDHFEGNAQSFRVVTRLSQRHTSHIGLDLTQRTLNAILKYPWQVQDMDVKKWGAYKEETEAFEFAREGMLNSREQSLEASIMDWADDITYAVHDAEDLFRAGLVFPDRLRDDAYYRSEFADWVHTRWALEGKTFKGKRIELETIKDTLLQVTALIPFATPFEGSTRDEALLRHHTSSRISHYIQFCTNLTYREGVWKLDISEEVQLEIDLLKQLTWRYLIEGPSLSAQQHGQKEVVTYIFHTLFEAANSNSRVDRNILPIRAREALETCDGTPHAKARIVADTICSMTEDEILRFHSRLTGASLGSVLDAIV